MNDKKNDFAEGSKILLDTDDLKIFVGSSSLKIISNTAKILMFQQIVERFTF